MKDASETGAEADRHKKARMTEDQFVMRHMTVPVDIVYTKEESEVKGCLRRIGADDAGQALSLQQRVVATLDGNEGGRMFIPLSDDEMQDMLWHSLCLGIFVRESLVAQAVLTLHPHGEFDLLPYVRDVAPDGIRRAVVVGPVMVDAPYRGYGMQRSLLRICEGLARRHGTKVLMAIVAPENEHSNRNFAACEYELLATQEIHGVMRNFWLRDARPRQS